VLWVGVYPGLTKPMLDYVAKIIGEVATGRNSARPVMQL